MPVAPFTGAWIEISSPGRPSPWPSVAPFTGAWIEIMMAQNINHNPDVAPFTGAWIEIPSGPHLAVHFDKSLPSRERGLK